MCEYNEKILKTHKETIENRIETVLKNSELDITKKIKDISDDIVTHLKEDLNINDENEKVIIYNEKVASDVMCYLYDAIKCYLVINKKEN